MNPTVVILAAFGALQFLSSVMLFLLWKRERDHAEQWYAKWEMLYRENTILISGAYDCRLKQAQGLCKPVLR